MAVRDAEKHLANGKTVMFLTGMGSFCVARIVQIGAVCEGRSIAPFFDPLNEAVAPG